MKDMDANIFVIGVPSLKGILSKVADAIEDEFFVKKLRVQDEIDDDDDYIDDDDEDDYEPEPPKRAENLRFGFSCTVNEPRKSDYNCRSKFLRDHKAYDDFVAAGLRCEELGLDKKDNCPITRCNAIRKRVGDLPPTGINLLGETDWWWEEDFTW